jgi:hypothetical protein
VNDISGRDLGKEELEQLAEVIAKGNLIYRWDEDKRVSEALGRKIWGGKGGLRKFWYGGSSYGDEISESWSE